MNRHFAPARLTALACAILLVAAATTAPDAHARANGKRAHRTNTAKFDNGSGETRKERERRLLRECKGMPNAGACLGYAS